MANDMLYFNPEDISQINMDLLMRILAHQKTQLQLRFNKTVEYSFEEVGQMIIKERDKVLEELFIQYGRTPDL